MRGRREASGRGFIRALTPVVVVSLVALLFAVPVTPATADSTTTAVLCPPDDGFEDNDTQATATGLGSGVEITGIACDDDWYTLSTFTPGWYITADAVFSHAAGNIDMTLSDPTGAVVESSTSETDNESISHQVTMDGAYALRVYGFAGAQNTYDLTLRGPLWYHDDFANAKVLAPGGGSYTGDTNWFATVESGEPAHRRFGPFRSVWYAFTPSVAGNAVFEVASHSTDYLVLAVYTGSSVDALTPVAAGGPASWPIAVEAPVSAGVTYHIAVAGETANDRGPFDLEWQMEPSLTCNGYAVTVDIGAGDSPTEGPDVILGTNGPDDIDGLGDDDSICGLDGDDVLAGGEGDDSIFGDGGDDTLKGQQNNDWLIGGSGNDLILGNAGDDVLIGEDGIDDLKGGSGVDYLDGFADDDEVRGGSGNDTLFGGDGDDVLNGGQDLDLVFGDGGNDVVNGAGSSDPTLSGDDGNDLVRGGNGGDVLNGGPGDDQLLGVLGADTLNGGPGNDDLRGGDGTDDVNGDEGDDDLRGGNGTDDCDGGVGGEVLGDEHLGGCETITNVP